MFDAHMHRQSGLNRWFPFWWVSTHADDQFDSKVHAVGCYLWHISILWKIRRGVLLLGTWIQYFSSSQGQQNSRLITGEQNFITFPHHALMNVDHFVRSRESFDDEFVERFQFINYWFCMTMVGQRCQCGDSQFDVLFHACFHHFFKTFSNINFEEAMKDVNRADIQYYFCVGHALQSLFRRIDCQAGHTMATFSDSTGCWKKYWWLNFQFLSNMCMHSNVQLLVIFSFSSMLTNSRKKSSPINS